MRSIKRHSPLGSRLSRTQTIEVLDITNVNKNNHIEELAKALAFGIQYILRNFPEIQGLCWPAGSVRKRTNFPADKHQFRAYFHCVPFSLHGQRQLRPPNETVGPRERRSR